ncbi:hypothetical protein BO85DRAFT_517649 [Aspergillus piperis CBS 112811]|uniref:Zn(2)-C6 fungal-type domain-containing protein n=1 Tax=Aspergillus piperis CBS 112811 TaxID=1448313 RepID=A0A8G1RBQ1_9EURO|nr:hypothetical protein BO85DRAFT_517649 [Aspergillus piperis CBS 112811]RAH61485.1 hypothetical protein BO85DRAFT_517649 [Aspergillus piperis CBS 112811]
MDNHHDRKSAPPCSQCRSRKVRCDRKKYTCGNCERLKHACSYERDNPSPGRPRHDRGHPGRRRGTRACIYCRLQKARCSGETPQCNNCHRRHQECQYPAFRGARQLSQDRDGKLTVKSSTRLVSLNELQQGLVYPVKDGAELDGVLDDYFLHLYPLPSYSFLHEPSIRRMCAAQTLEPSLVLSMCALVKLRCRPSGSQSQPSESMSLIELSEKRIWDMIETPSIFRLQALFLIIQYHAEVGRFERAFMMASIASRHVTALQLKHESPHLSFVTQEIRRRAAWTMALLDGYFSVGLPGYSTINYEEIYQQYPCREEEFGSTDPDTIRGPSTARVENKAHYSMLELILRISRVRRDIMRFTRQLALLEQPLKEFQGIVQGFQMNLTQLQEKIASVVGSSATGTIIQPNFRWVVRSLEIQLAWRQAHCDLFRLFLLGHPNAAPDVVLRPLGSSTYASQAQEICQEHSDWIIESIKKVRKMNLQVLFSFDIARCAYQAARLNLFLAHMPNVRPQLTSESAVSNAAECLAFIKERFVSSAHAQRMISDLSLLIGAYETRDGHFGAAMALDSLRFSGDALEKHKQLSAHSLIHQANFVDDSYLYEL